MKDYGRNCIVSIFVVCFCLNLSGTEYDSWFLVGLFFSAWLVCLFHGLLWIVKQFEEL